MLQRAGFPVIWPCGHGQKEAHTRDSGSHGPAEPGDHEAVQGQSSRKATALSSSADGPTQRGEDHEAARREALQEEELALALHDLRDLEKCGISVQWPAG